MICHLSDGCKQGERLSRFSEENNGQETDRFLSLLFLVFLFFLSFWVSLIWGGKKKEEREERRKRILSSLLERTKSLSPSLSLSSLTCNVGHDIIVWREHSSVLFATFGTFSLLSFSLSLSSFLSFLSLPFFFPYSFSLVGSRKKEGKDKLLVSYILVTFDRQPCTNLLGSRKMDTSCSDSLSLSLFLSSSLPLSFFLSFSRNLCFYGG